MIILPAVIPFAGTLPARHVDPRASHSARTSVDIDHPAEQPVPEDSVALKALHRPGRRK